MKNEDWLELALQVVARRGVHPAVGILLAVGAVALSSPEVRKHLRVAVVEGAAAVIAAGEALKNFGLDVREVVRGVGQEAERQLKALPGGGSDQPLA